LRDFVRRSRRRRIDLVMSRFLWAVLAAAGCSNSFTYKSQQLVPSTPCGQGPYDFTVTADGKMASEGVEVVACAPHLLVGHAEVTATAFDVPMTFGDKLDNARCVAGNATVVATQSASSPASTPAHADGGGTSAASAFVEQPYSGTESPFEDDLCKPYGVPAQIVVRDVTFPTDMVPAGSRMHVRIWSDAPNDLERAVFFVRHVTSTQTKAEAQAEAAKAEREAAAHPQPPPKHVDAPPRQVDAPPPDHGPPPAPIVEERPTPPDAGATWIAGYWTWTGSSWGWVAGFWRDDRVATPAPRVEMPGAPPATTAVWIVGGWQHRAGTWVWIRGRWR
jgi:hypothetical protein